MKKYLLILLLLSCSVEEKECSLKTCFRMTISDALSVQFWLNGIPTFNEKDESGIEKICFYQLFNSEDEIRIQIQDNPGKAFNLEIYDIDDELITTIAFDEIESGVYNLTFIPVDQTPAIVSEMIKLKIINVEAFNNANFSDGLDEWENIVSATGAPWGVPFTKASTQLSWSLVAGTKETYHLRHDFFQTIPTARVINYSIEVTDATIGGLVGASNFYARYRKDGVAVGGAQLIRNILPGAFGSVISDSFVTDQTDFDEIEFYFTGAVSTGAAEGDINYDVELFEIQNLLSGEVAYSDYIDIQEVHADTRTIDYSNDNDYAGIIYDMENVPSFKIRVESKFYEPQLPQEVESDDDGAGTVIFLSGSVKEQRLLEFEPLPPYMLKKLALIFKHKTTYMENFAWIAEEELKFEKMNDKHGLFLATIVLTKRDDSYLPNVN